MDKVREELTNDLTIMVKNKVISKTEALYLLQQPMLDVTHGLTVDEINNQIDKSRNLLITQQLNDFRPLPFPICSVWVKNYGFYLFEESFDELDNCSYKIKLIPHSDEDGKLLNLIANVSLLFKIDTMPDTGASHVMNIQVTKVRTSLGERKDLLEPNCEFVKALGVQVLSVFSYIQNYIDTNIYEKRFAFKVIREKQTRAITKNTRHVINTATKNMPRIVYLNVLPSESNPTGVTRSKQKYHQRIAHSKTLKHERYKNHPMYGIENGIKIKSYWVGEETTTYQGNIYKLLPTENNGA